MERDEKAVASNLDFFRINRLQWRKERNLYTQVFELSFVHRGEPRVFHCRAGGASHDRLAQALAGIRHPDTTLQSPPNMKRHEDASTLGENAFFWDSLREPTMKDSFGRRLTS
ncbi:MAG TPA: hypothetical protein VMH48_00845 [Methylomirabilota bacterium]|nr:hypothetical protein [Methylomirabilota bacterium]